MNLKKQFDDELEGEYITTETRKGYDVTREHRQQGCVSPIEERVNMYKQMMAEEQAREDEKAH